MFSEHIRRRLFLSALLANFVWINLSEIARYFWVIRPMLHDAFPGQSHIAPMDWSIFALWGIWDIVLVVGATGFFWLWLERFGTHWQQIFVASLGFTITIFGLIWLGIANMGLAPYSLLFAALPMAWIEQLVACYIVAMIQHRTHAPSSIRSI
ncbi:hypothetical protein [uncultured Erythrobacter sp.]|uniref:hypothetical protein n=1 Tax=uncultured Erythrobacter sp. TaxID=263913 RepID=UPI00260CCA6F|nr:hypothetical protein [uncultured Erythrobacter sp.]